MELYISQKMKGFEFNMSFKEDFEYHMEDVIRYIYDIPTNQRVAVTLNSKMDMAQVNAPFLSKKNIPIYVEGLVSQVRNVSSVSTFFCVKRRFIKNVIKNSINLTEPCLYFDREINYLARNIKNFNDKLDFKITRVKSIQVYINNISSKYGISLSKSTINSEQKKCLNALFTLKKIKDSRKIEKKVVIELKKGIVEVIENSMVLLSHDLTSGEIKCNVDTDALFSLFKNMKTFFEEIIPRQLNADMLSLSKGINLLNSKDKEKIIFPCQCDDMCETFFVKGIPMSHESIKQIFIERYNQISNVIKKNNQNLIYADEAYANSLDLDKIIIDYVYAHEGIKADSCAQKLAQYNERPYSDLLTAIGGLIEKGLIVKTKDEKLMCSENIRKIVKKHSEDCDCTNGKIFPNQIKNLGVLDMKRFLESPSKGYSNAILEAVLETMEQGGYVESLSEQYLSFFEKYSLNENQLALAKVKIALFS